MVKHEEFCECYYIEESHANCSISKIRKRLSLCKKLEICEHYVTDRNYSKTTRVFGLQDSTISKICKAAPPNKINKG